MRSYYKYITIAAMGLLTACSADDLAEQDSDAIHEPVILKAGIEQEAPTSRANTHWGTTEYGKTFSTSPLWGTNLRIALAFSDKESDLSTAAGVNSKVKEYKVTENAKSASIVPLNADNTHYWSSKTKDHYATGWCTNYVNSDLSASYQKNRMTNGSVPTVQSTYDEVNRRDVLFAPVQAVKYPSGATSASLNFYHQKTRIDVKVNFVNNDYTFTSNIISGKFKNAYYYGTWTYTSGNYGSWTPSGSKVDITICKTDKFYSLMIPQPLRGITFELTTNIPNNETISYTFDEDTVLEPGKFYFLTFNFSQEKGLTLETEITDWTPKTMTTGDAEFEYNP